jgi:predicted GIY-YIG superfamily endonuclease
MIREEQGRSCQLDEVGYRSRYVKSTVMRKLLKLIYYEACLNEADARKCEKYLKSGAGKKYLRNRLKRYLGNL